MEHLSFIANRCCYGEALGASAVFDRLFIIRVKKKLNRQFVSIFHLWRNILDLYIDGHRKLGDPEIETLNRNSVFIDAWHNSRELSRSGFLSRIHAGKINHVPLKWQELTQESTVHRIKIRLVESRFVTFASLVE